MTRFTPASASWLEADPTAMSGFSRTGLWNPREGTEYWGTVIRSSAGGTEALGRGNSNNKDGKTGRSRAQLGHGLEVETSEQLGEIGLREGQGYRNEFQSRQQEAGLELGWGGGSIEKRQV